ncbi:hypothetical protein H5410_003641 [Solanum commersonii]|uniref:Exo_endo_phos domain-containing protein n=1 Tax=Solanum commersonii TaxID=4109 RepID=A0A9J6B5Q5_SOLCO|nr:hypothetical protein H5410_003641 [Solanum commersonii]
MKLKILSWNVRELNNKNKREEVTGTRRGIVIMWNKRSYKGELVNTSAYSITTGVYGPHNRLERRAFLGEFVARRGICEGPWVVCGDFNTTRFIHERCSNPIFTRAMNDFSDFIQDMGLIDPPLFGGSFTWNRGNSQGRPQR